MNNMPNRIFSQLVAGKSEQSRFSIEAMAAKLKLAKDRIGLDTVLFWPSRNRELDASLRGCCRDLGMGLYLWYPVLADTGGDPLEAEMVVDAWGGKGQGKSGCWGGLATPGDENFLFACPRAEGVHNKNIARLELELPDYDGVFLDRIRYPSPANGLEMLFSCFCPRCLDAEGEAVYWRKSALEARKWLECASDGDLERLDGLIHLFRDFGLDRFFANKAKTIAKMTAPYVKLAMKSDKTIGLDLFSPMLSALVGQDYEQLGALSDWVKPMSYCHARGPAGLPLEIVCLVRGLTAWGRGLSESAVMDFVGKSFSLTGLPRSAESLEMNGLREDVAGREFNRANRIVHGRVYPGFECVQHPDFSLNMTEAEISRYLSSLSSAPVLILSWNILYTPESFMKVVAGRG